MQGNVKEELRWEFFPNLLGSSPFLYVRLCPRAPNEKAHDVHCHGDNIGDNLLKAVAPWGKDVINFNLKGYFNVQHTKHINNSQK